MVQRKTSNDVCLEDGSDDRKAKGGIWWSKRENSEKSGVDLIKNGLLRERLQDKG